MSSKTFSQIFLLFLILTLSGCINLATSFADLSSIKVTRRGQGDERPVVESTTSETTTTRSLELSSGKRPTPTAAPTTQKVKRGDSVVVGSVRDSINSEPLSEALVQIDDQQVLTDSAGFFRLEDLEEGPTKLIATKEGYRSFAETIEVKDLKQVKDIFLTVANEVVIEESTKSETTTVVDKEKEGS